MRAHKETYTRLLEIMGKGYSLGEHPIGGTYIEFLGNGFHRICLYEYEKAPQNTFSLMVFAGDTCAQARELFKHFSYAKVIDLEKGLADTICEQLLAAFFNALSKDPGSSS